MVRGRSGEERRTLDCEMVYGLRLCAGRQMIRSASLPGWIVPSTEHVQFVSRWKIIDPPFRPASVQKKTVETHSADTFHLHTNDHISIR